MSTQVPHTPTPGARAATRLGEAKHREVATSPSDWAELDVSRPVVEGALLTRIDGNREATRPWRAAKREVVPGHDDCCAAVPALEAGRLVATGGPRNRTSGDRDATQPRTPRNARSPQPATTTANPGEAEL